MNIPLFTLQSPITLLHKSIDLLIKKSEPRVYSRQLFGVPLSAVVNESEHAKEAVRANRYGKIPVLLVDYQSYAPLGAVIIESASERAIVEGVEKILTKVGLPFVTVNSATYVAKVKQLLIEISNETTPKLSKPINDIEALVSG